jgi:hypothetical protein
VSLVSGYAGVAAKAAAGPLQTAGRSRLLQELRSQAWVRLLQRLPQQRLLQLLQWRPLLCQLHLIVTS